MGVELATAYVALKVDGRQVPAGVRRSLAGTEGIANQMGARSGKAFGSGFSRSTISTDKAMERIGKASRRVFLGSAGAIVFAEKKAADYNAQMATVFTLSHANTKQQEALSKAAMSVGANIGYSATQSAQAQEELVKAGVSVQNILTGGLKGALDLAAAGQTDVATATEVAASAMTQFKLRGAEVPHIADLLAAGADKALGSVTDLGYGLAQVGTVAHQMGFSIEATTGTLAELAQNGLLGEKGGAALKQMLLRLANPTKKSQALMDQFGLSLYKANGQIKSMPELAGNLQKAFSKLTPAQRNAALGTIFGTRAIQAANILYKDGEKVNRRWISSVNDSGFAAHQAAGKMNSLKGDLQKLDAQLGNAFINASGTQGFLRGEVQNITHLVGDYNKLGDSQRHAIDNAVKYTAIISGGIWAATKVYRLAKSASEVAGWMSRVTGGKRASSGFGSASGITGTRVWVENWPGELGGSLGTRASRVGVTPVVAGGLAKESRMAVAGRLLITAATVELTATVVAPLLKQLNNVGSPGHEKALAPTPGAGQQFDKPKTNDWTKFALGPGHTYKDDAKNALAATTAVGKLNVAVREGLSGLIHQQSYVGTSVKNFKDLDNALSGLNYAAPQEGAAAFNTVMQKTGLTSFQLDKILPKTAASMEKTSGANATMNRMLLGAATNGAKAGYSARNATSDYTRLGKMMHSLPQGVQTKISSPGFVPTSANVRKLQRQYDLAKRPVNTLIKLLGGPAAIAAADRVDARLNALQGKSVNTYIHTITTSSGAGTKKPAQNLGQLLGKHAAGGRIVGPGGPRDDLVPALLSNGEFVINAAAYARNRALVEAINANRRASGGPVGNMRVATPAAGPGGGGSFELVITNWDEGTGYIQSISDESYYANQSLQTQNR